MRISYQILITIATLIVGIGVLFSIVAFPSLKSIIHLSATIEQERIRIEQIISHALKMQQTTADIKKVTEGLPKIEAMLVNAGEETELFTALEQKSKAYNLTKTLYLEEKGTSTQDPIKNMPLEIELHGPFLNTLRFLSDIEHSEILLPFHNITEQHSLTTRGDKHPFTSTLRGTIYVSK